MVKSSGVALIFVLLHIADDLAAGGFGDQSLVFATGIIFLAAIWVAGLALSANQNWVGYAIVLVFSAFGLLVALSHTTGLGPSIVEVGQNSGPFFAWVVLVAGTSSLIALALSVYALTWGRRFLRPT